MSGPLSGLRVIDLSRVLAGPYCTMLLGDAGADVIKVEGPAGDDTRAWGPPYAGGEAAYYLSANRNKRDIVLDLRREEARQALLRLIASADVVIENFKLGTMEAWGLGYESRLQPLNQGLIYCNISGFGRTGPYAHLPGYDFMVQAMGGLMSITGQPGGEPTKVGVAVTDLMTGMLAAYGITAALHHRSFTGAGQRVDLSLLETQVSALANVGTNFLASGRVPGPMGNAHPNVVPYQTFRARDRPFAVAVGNDVQFQRLCAILGRPDWAGDPRFATNPARLTHREELIPLLSAVVATKDADEWVALLWEAGIPGGPINTIDRVFSDPQVLHREMLAEVPHPTAGTARMAGTPVKFAGTPGAIRRHPPLLGEHTQQILAEAGLTESEIEGLLQNRAAVQWRRS